MFYGWPIRDILFSYWESQRLTSSEGIDKCLKGIEDMWAKNDFSSKIYRLLCAWYTRLHSPQQEG
jgi:hypothetical protein